jgi:hypothetical protein
MMSSRYKGFYEPLRGSACRRLVGGVRRGSARNRWLAKNQEIRLAAIGRS